MTEAAPTSGTRLGNGGPPAHLPIWSRLRTRFALVLAMALLPIGMVSMYMTAQVQGQIQVQTETTLMGETLRAATPEIGLIQQARGLAAGLAAALASVQTEPIPDAVCNRMLRNLQQSTPEVSLVIFVPRSGLMTCASNGQSHDFNGNPRFESIRDGQRPRIMTIRDAAITGVPILSVSHPVFDLQEQYAGYVNISLPQSGLEQLSGPFPDMLGTAAGTIHFLTFDRDGEILTASSGVDIADFQRPRDRSLASLVGQPPSVFQAESQTGALRTFAVMPLVEDRLYLLSSWTASADTSALSPYIPTVAMLLAGLIAAGWASERLVARHVRKLSRAMARFAAGERQLHENVVRGAPAELATLGQAFSEMSNSITHGEAALEDVIHQREMLLREVHHRVKNNLQLMASIMNMQRRRAATTEAQRMIKRLQDRIISLATIHRGLYETSSLATVRADELLSDIVQQSARLALGPGSSVSIETDFDPVKLDRDQAVPLALFLTEAIGTAAQNLTAMQHGPTRIRASLKTQDDTRATLQVAYTRADDTVAVSASGPEDELGMRLLATFARQIGGALISESVEHEFRHTLSFTLQQRHEGAHEDTYDDAAAHGV